MSIYIADFGDGEGVCIWAQSEEDAAQQCLKEQGRSPSRLTFFSESVLRFRHDDIGKFSFDKKTQKELTGTVCHKTFCDALREIAEEMTRKKKSEKAI